MGINNLLYQYQDTNEFVCSDGRMSVNGICQAPQPVVEQPVIKQPVINNNQGGGGDGKDTFTKDYSKDGFGITSEGNYVNQFSGGDPGSVSGKDYSKDVKSNFQWDFDKVGNKIENFGDTIKGNIDAYDKYVEDNLGISKNVSNVFRAGAVVKGVGAYGMAGVLAPFAIPFMAGGALNAKQQKENERITNITNQDTQGSDNTVDMATYGIPTAGQPGFNIHNDAGDNNNNNNQNTGGGASYDNAASTGAKDGFGYGL